MSSISGTNVVDKIVPFDTDDTYPTHDDEYGAGGLKTNVANALARVAIPTARRKAGMLVYQVDTEDYYKLENDLTTWTNKGGLSGGGGGSGLFTDLLDVPSSYAGQAGKVAVVNGTEDGLEFTDATGGVSQAVVALTDAPIIATDASLGSTFTVTLGDNRVLGEPTNPTDGQKVIWRFKQDVSGSRTITFDAIFRTASSLGTITLSTAGGTTDYIGAIYNGDDSRWDILAFAKGI